MPKPNQEEWVSWLQSIEDAARSLKSEVVQAERWPEIVKIDETLWTMHRDITAAKREGGGNGSVDMPGM